MPCSRLQATVGRDWAPERRDAESHAILMAVT